MKFEIPSTESIPTTAFPLSTFFQPLSSHNKHTKSSFTLFSKSSLSLSLKSLSKFNFDQWKTVMKLLLLLSLSLSTFLLKISPHYLILIPRFRFYSNFNYFIFVHVCLILWIYWDETAFIWVFLGFWCWLFNTHFEFLSVSLIDSLIYWNETVVIWTFLVF